MQITVEPPPRPALLFSEDARRHAYRGLVMSSLSDRDVTLIELGWQFAMTGCRASECTEAAEAVARAK